MGWDNLMPEFNLWLNLKRSLFGVWQEYRGLGLLDGLSQAATLFHTLYIAVLSVVLNQSMVRYVFIFGTHLVGGIGFFLLLRYLTKNAKASFFGALFYMLNLAVVQMYFAPLEAFAVHFAALPLLAFFATKAMDKPSLKNYLVFLLFALLTTPQSFVPTFFIVFCIFLVFLLFCQAKSKKSWKEAITIFVLFVSANLFWLLPYSYSAAYNAKIIPQTRINQFSSEEIFYRNKAFGDLYNVFRLNGFMIDTVEYDNLQHKNDYFMSSWRSYQNTLFYNLSYLAFLLAALAGLFFIIRQKRKEFYPYIGAFLASFFFLANNTPLLAQVNQFLRSAFPVFAEVLRFPFTKFAILFAFTLSVFATFGVSYLFEKFAALKKLIIVVVIAASIGISIPAFQGYFVSPLLRVKLPQEYLDLMSYLDKKDANEKIALLPAHTFWNWQYRQWGQRGSGFLWYGIKQPILERPFDPWSLYNEQFYNELSYAINSQQADLLRKTLLKYDVSYVLVDHNIVNNLSSKPINYDQLDRFLTEADSLKREQEFGTLTLYKNTASPPWVYSLPQNSPNLFNTFFVSNKDVIYDQLGNYISASIASIWYPFASLYSGKLQDNLQFITEESQNSIAISPKQQIALSGQSVITLPNLFVNESLIPVKVELKNGALNLLPLYPTIYVNGQKLNQQSETLSLSIERVVNPLKITLTDDDQEIKSGDFVYIRNKYLNIFKLEGKGIIEHVKFDTRVYKPPEEVFQYKVDSVKDIKIEFPKIKSSYTYEHLIKSGIYKVYVPTRQEVLLKRADSFVKTKEDKKNQTVSFEVKGNSADLSLWAGNLLHDASYIIFARNKYDEGLPVSFSVDNPFEKRAELETRLSKKGEKNIFILPPTQKYFQGYGFHFTVKSVGTEISKNTIEDLSLYPFPYETLTNLRVERQGSTAQTIANKSSLPFEKSSYFSYTINPLENSNGSLVLSQSYHPGWIAYQNGKELKNHVLVDNWANGWELNKDVSITNDGLRNNPQSAIRNSKIVVIFWPQYLEFAGFGLAIISLLIVAAGGGGGVTRQASRRHVGSGRKPPTGPAAT